MPVDTKAVLDKEGVPNEMLTHDDLVRRYPQMSLEGIGFGFFEPTTGVLKAREGCLAVAEAFQRKGGRVTMRKLPRPALGPPARPSRPPAAPASRRRPSSLPAGPGCRRCFPN